MPRRKYYGRELRRLIVQLARRHNLDPHALLAVASVEGGFHGATGDNGSSFGPFQLHVGGALPAGRSREWANTQAGVAYAVRQIAGVARGQSGRRAVRSIVYNFERPAAPGAEVERAMNVYGSVPGGGGGHVGGGGHGGYYVNPYRHFGSGRIDQGKDFTGSGYIGAIGKAKITRIDTSSGWPGGGMVVYKLLTGPMRGRYVYLAENIAINATLKVGQVVKPGQHIAFARGKYPYIETGWSNAHGVPVSHSWYVTQPDGTPTKGGKAFAAFLDSIGSGKYVSGGPLNPTPVSGNPNGVHVQVPPTATPETPSLNLPGQPGVGPADPSLPGQPSPSGSDPRQVFDTWQLLSAQPGLSPETQAFARRAQLFSGGS